MGGPRYRQNLLQATSYETSRLIAAKLGLDESQYTVAFQSRLDKWLTPFSDEVIEEFARQGMKRLRVLAGLRG